MPLTDFLKFGSSLVNLEKTRNFNVFKEYSLEAFRNFLDKHTWRKRLSPRIRISVVGTNGKGSVSHFLSQTFSKLNQSVGLYTSPHLLSPAERIRKGPDFDPVSSTDLETIAKLIFENAEEAELSGLSWFEWFTLGAFVYFESQDLNIQIYEAGLGGRLDATSLAEPDVVVLCSIGEDHKAILGDTKEKILLEKLNIAGPKTKLLLSMPHENDLNEIVRSFCSEKGIQLAFFERKSEEAYLLYNLNFALWATRTICDRISSTVSFLKIPNSDNNKRFFDERPFVSYSAGLKAGFRSPPGRLEILSKDPFVIFDPAHNPDAVRTTLRDISVLYPEKKLSVIAGFLPDKDGESMAKDLDLFVKNHGTRFAFLNGPEFKLPNGFESFALDPNDFSKRLFDFSREGTLVLGSFRLYKYAVDAIQRNTK
ncbi:bifunctional protein FolC [Leptospira inadai serovar Lyme str. 10]|uniref:Dihydrofolate synthase/folylpolyglutamate synthase n=2 Tax=Leptospira inadai serovar Lyme TaxID=293084 RepID=V6HCZ7_9LEPT|nr:cyanophycin synthetase [Leptospira inadai]EQA37876.1 bifunctional protein FolC [Leptospira inadai serovar Lyme str. 10]PNV74987.1 bifunctional folylpolyglutamate synthase/dihydrofolate synthase [Leptospira inadai serovar Lyme]